MIAILGATGYIGKSLAREFSARHRALTLFARDPESLRHDCWPQNVRCESLADFDASRFELVVNAIGAGDPARVASMGAEILDVTQRWDDAVLSSMADDTAYVFLSSGAIYGGGFDRPVGHADTLSIPINDLSSVPPYTIAKLYAEVKHRFHPDRAILDLRVFGYADAAIGREGRFFLAELMRSIQDETPFTTSPLDMVRDYAGRRELADLILAWHAAGKPNCAADLYTTEPVSKNRMLDVAESRFALKVVRTAIDYSNPTGAKNIYASDNRTAASFGYSPGRSALDIVIDMIAAVTAP